jgi:hypothetical protein
MAYPVIDAPYGLKPINLIGGQVFAGSTRTIPIQYNDTTAIYYGDFVRVLRGFVSRLAVTTAGGAAGMVGIFLGCSYTNPATKQKVFSQYYPGSIAAGDIQAIVCDDPDTVFKSAIVASSGSTTVTSAAPAMVGQNLQASNLVGNTNTGNSSNALIIPAATTSSAYVARVVAVVNDTAQSLGTATFSSGTTTLTVSALPFALPVGTDVSVLTTNGQSAQTGSYVATAAAAGDTSVVLNAAATFTLNSGVYTSTVVFTQYPEVLVKLNFGIHEYYTATAV